MESRQSGSRQIGSRQTGTRQTERAKLARNPYIDHYNARTLAAGNVYLQDDIFLDERSCRRC